MEENLNRPEPVEVEEYFNQFVLEEGGNLVSDMISKNSESLNADYYWILRFE